MNRSETETVRSDPTAARAIDAVDRTLLGALAEDAARSYAELGALVNLSPPAVHQRVKRLRENGSIRGTVALLDGTAIGRPLLAFVNLDTSGWGVKRELRALLELPEIEEMHTVTGDSCVLLKVRVSDSGALEGLLARLYEIEGVSGSHTQVVLSTYLERTPRAEVTGAMASWAEEMSR